MVESGKTSTNSQGYQRYTRSKAAADAKKAAKPAPETLEQKESIASRAFHACTKNEWKGIRATFPTVQEMVGHASIQNAPADFSKLTKESCKMAGAKGASDLAAGINTFRFTYTTADNKKAYFPIVTSEYNSFKLNRARTISAQQNPLLTGLTEDKVETQDNSVVEEESVNEDMAELERLALLASHENSVQQPEEETTTNAENLKDLQELEKMAAQADLEKENYHPYLEHNHIQKHDTQETGTQTDDEDTYGLEHLYREHTDVNDHVTGSDETNTEEEESRPLLGGGDHHDYQLLEDTQENTQEDDEEERMNNIKPLFSDVDEEDAMNNIKPLFSDIEDSVEHKEPAQEETTTEETTTEEEETTTTVNEEKTTEEEEKTTFHDPNHEEYDFFARKNANKDELHRTNHLEEEQEVPEEHHHVQLLGGWSKPGSCSDEEKHNTLAYVSKMTLSGKMLGLMPTTQNMMSCAHQIVAGTNFSVIIQINNDICEAVYTVDLENIIHDLDKSYARREVPCVDMYARHLF